MTNPDGSSPRNRGFGFGEVIKVGEDGRDEDDDRRGEAMGDEGLEGDIAVEWTDFMSWSFTVDGILGLDRDGGR